MYAYISYDNRFELSTQSSPVLHLPKQLDLDFIVTLGPQAHNEIYELAFRIFRQIELAKDNHHYSYKKFFIVCDYFQENFEEAILTQTCDPVELVSKKNLAERIKAFVEKGGSFTFLKMNKKFDENESKKINEINKVLVDNGYQFSGFTCIPFSTEDESKAEQIESEINEGVTPFINE